MEEISTAYLRSQTISLVPNQSLYQISEDYMPGTLTVIYYPNSSNTNYTSSKLLTATDFGSNYFNISGIDLSLISTSDVIVCMYLYKQVIDTTINNDLVYLRKQVLSCVTNQSIYLLPENYEPGTLTVVYYPSQTNLSYSSSVLLTTTDFGNNYFSISGINSSLIIPQDKLVCYFLYKKTLDSSLFTQKVEKPYDYIISQHTQQINMLVDMFEELKNLSNEKVPQKDYNDFVHYISESLEIVKQSIDNNSNGGS